MSMLGNQETYGLSAKAAESHGLLKFVLWLLEKYSDEFEKLPEETSRPLAILKAATQAANNMDDILSVEIRKLSRKQCEQLLQHYLRFLTLYLKAGGVWRSAICFCILSSEHSCKATRDSILLIETRVSMESSRKSRGQHIG